MNTENLDRVVTGGLTFGSIVKLAVLEWVFCEILITAFLLFRGFPSGIFSMALPGGAIVNNSSQFGNFVVLSLFALLAVGGLSLCLFIGQWLITWVTPISLRFRRWR